MTYSKKAELAQHLFAVENALVNKAEEILREVAPGKELDIIFDGADDFWDVGGPRISGGKFWYQLNTGNHRIKLPVPRTALSPEQVVTLKMLHAEAVAAVKAWSAEP